MIRAEATDARHRSAADDNQRSRVGFMMFSSWIEYGAARGGVYVVGF
jgi:hypothetical protein